MTGPAARGWAGHLPQLFDPDVTAFYSDAPFAALDLQIDYNQESSPCRRISFELALGTGATELERGGHHRTEIAPATMLAVSPLCFTS